MKTYLRHSLISVSALAILAANCATTTNAQGTGKPKLILQITVDQLRGDIPSRYYDRLGEGGFRYLMENGTVYQDANHPHANTETIVGHVTLATGAVPAAHGMVDNVWLDSRASPACGRKQ